MFAHAASADEFEGSEYVLEADWHLRPMVSVEEGNKTAISSRRAEQHGRPCFFQADATVPPAPERKWQIVALTEAVRGPRDRQWRGRKQAPGIRGACAAA